MFKNIYCFSGNEYLVREKVKLWKESFAQKHKDTMNIICLYYEKSEDVHQIVQEIESLPFLSSFKLIFIYNFLESKKRTTASDDIEQTAHKKEENADIFQKIEDACERSYKSSIIVFVSSSPDKRRSLYKKFSTENIKDFSLTDHLMITGFEDGGKQLSLMGFFMKKYAGRVTRDVLEYLLFSLFPKGMKAQDIDLFLFDNELQKLQSYCSGRTITLEDVDALIPKTLFTKIFDLTDAIGFGDVKKAICIMNDLLFKGEDIHALWGVILSHFRKILTVKAMLQEKKSMEAIRSYLGKASFTINKVTTQAQKFSLKKLKKIYDMLLDIDVQRKTGGIYITTTDTIAFQLALEKLIIRASSKEN